MQKQRNGGMIEIRVQGLPGAQGSKNATRWGGMKESSPKVAPWRAAVAYACEQQWEGEPITDPVEMQITFLLPRARTSLEQSQGQRGPAAAVRAAALHQQRPWGDIDKLARSTLDGCAVRSGGCLIADDSQVVSLALAKRYAERLEPTGAVVRLRIAP